MRKVSLYLTTLVTKATNTTQMRRLCENLKVSPKWKAKELQNCTWLKANPGGIHAKYGWLSFKNKPWICRSAKE